MLLLIGSVVLGAFFVWSSLGCALTEDEAQQIAGTFLRQLHLAPAGPLKVMRRGFKHGWFGESVIELAHEDEDGDELYVSIDCVAKQVWFFGNSQQKARLRKQYRLKPIVTDQPYPWPTVITKEEAVAKGQAYARALQLPESVVFTQAVYNAPRGLWQLGWNRKQGEYVFEDQYAYMALLGVDGSLETYKADYGAPVEESELRVSQEDAVEEGWRQVVRRWGVKPEWRDAYEAQAFLLYMRPWKVSFWPIPQRSARLAWKVWFQKKKEIVGKQLVGVQFYIAYIDAENKQYLAGDREKGCEGCD
jgi:hypothetical protein